MKEKKKGWKKTKTYLSQVDEGEQQSVPLEARHRAGPGKPCGKERRIKRVGNSPWSWRLADGWQPGQGEDRGRFRGGQGRWIGGGFGGSVGADGGWVLGGSGQPLPQSHVSWFATGFVQSLKNPHHQTLINSPLVLIWQVREWGGVWVTRGMPLPPQPETNKGCSSEHVAQHRAKVETKPCEKARGIVERFQGVGCEATRAFSGFGGKPVNKQLHHSRKRNVWHTETKQAEPGRKPFFPHNAEGFFPLSRGLHACHLYFWPLHYT